MPKRTPLYEIHKQLGARMVEFGGWEMPVVYSSIRQEHQGVRERVGLFDISHMGQVILQGSDSHAAVQSLTCNDIDRLSPQQCQYSALLTPEGTFVDDIIVYPLAADHFLLCVNATNTDKDFQWIKSHLPKSVTVRDESAEWCQLALQGPCAFNIIKEIGGDQAAQLARFHFISCKIAGIESLVSRTGYTGEDGFEIYAPAAIASELWNQFIAAGKPHGIVPCGLGARDTLRLEAAYPLYGHEIDDLTNPYEARLGWIVRLQKNDFVGKEALTAVKAKGIERQLIGFRMDEAGIPRQGYNIYVDDKASGTVASGTLSPSLNVGIGTGFLPIADSGPERKIAIDIRNKKRKATIIPLPFYK